ncbi:MAG: type III-A CRISPR-associated protein Csm2 [Methanobrevibacter sp.]
MSKKRYNRPKGNRGRRGKKFKKSKKEEESEKKSKELKNVEKELNNFNKLTDIPIEKIVDINGYAYNIAKNSDEININQIRKFFSVLRLAERRENWETHFFRFKAELTISYTRNLISIDFYRIIINLINKVNNCNEKEQYQNFKIFVVFFESIVAYHKYFNVDKDEKEKYNENFKGLYKIKKELNELNNLSELSNTDITDNNGYADRISKEIQNLPNSQLRKFFNNIRLIDKRSNWKEIEYDFFLLKPQLAVAVGRTIIPQNFFEIMNILMDNVNKGDNQHKYNNFKIFVNFYESIIAYHNFYNQIEKLEKMEQK